MKPPRGADRGGRAVAARHGDMCGRRVQGAHRVEIRLIGIDFAGVDRANDRIDLGEAELHSAVDEPRVDEEPGRVDHARAGRRREGGADRRDDPVLDHQRSVAHRRRADGDEGRVDDCQLFARRRRNLGIGGPGVVAA